MSKSLLDITRDERAALIAPANTIVAKAEAEERGITDAELAEIRTAKEATAAIDERIAELVSLDARNRSAATTVAAIGGAKVKTEERTYTANKAAAGTSSFFRDAFFARSGDLAAQERINRHAREVTVEGEALEARAVASSGFAGLVVPQYLVDLAAEALRNGRPFANACTKLPMPAEGTSFIVPRGTTGASAAIQATENAAMSNTDEVWGNVTVPVATIAGQQQVSRQSIERGTPGLDALIYLDLAGAYQATLDTQLWTGSGSAGQVLGVQNTSGIGAATAFGAAVTAVNFTSKLAGQIAAVAGAGAQVSPKAIFMHPRRWGFLNSLVDSQNRPIVQPVANGPFNVTGINLNPGGYGVDSATGTSGYNVVGYLQGLPVITDANIPTAVGSATGGEDLVFVVDTRQMLLWEQGDGMPQMLRFEQTLGNQLTVLLAVYGYAAFTAGRYPTATGKIGGLDTTTNGLVAPAF